MFHSLSLELNKLVTIDRLSCLLCISSIFLQDRSASKKHHVHGCTLVRAKKLYGYHSTEELFVKIYLYPIFSWFLADYVMFRKLFLSASYNCCLFFQVDR